MTDIEQAFMRAYKSCIGTAPTYDLEYFFANRDKAQDVDYYEEKQIVSEIEYWSHIEDAWLMWVEAISYSKEITV